MEDNKNKDLKENGVTSNDSSSEQNVHSTGSDSRNTDGNNRSISLSEQFDNLLNSLDIQNRESEKKDSLKISSPEENLKPIDFVDDGISQIFKDSKNNENSESTTSADIDNDSIETDIFDRDDLDDQSSGIDIVYQNDTDTSLKMKQDENEPDQLSTIFNESDSDQVDLFSTNTFAHDSSAISSSDLEENFSSFNTELTSENADFKRDEADTEFSGVWWSNTSKVDSEDSEDISKDNPKEYDNLNDYGINLASGEDDEKERLLFGNPDDESEDEPIESLFADVERGSIDNNPMSLDNSEYEEELSNSLFKDEPVEEKTQEEEDKSDISIFLEKEDEFLNSLFGEEIAEESNLPEGDDDIFDVKESDLEHDATIDVEIGELDSPVEVESVDSFSDFGNLLENEEIAELTTQDSMDELTTDDTDESFNISSSSNELSDDDVAKSESEMEDVSVDELFGSSVETENDVDDLLRVDESFRNEILNSKSSSFLDDGDDIENIRQSEVESEVESIEKKSEFDLEKILDEEESDFDLDKLLSDDEDDFVKTLFTEKEEKIEEDFSEEKDLDLFNREEETYNGLDLTFGGDEKNKLIEKSESNIKADELLTDDSDRLPKPSGFLLEDEERIKQETLRNSSITDKDDMFEDSIIANTKVESEEHVTNSWAPQNERRKSSGGRRKEDLPYIAGVNLDELNLDYDGVDIRTDNKFDFEELLNNKSLMTVDDIYRKKRLTNTVKDTVFMIEVYEGTLPENLPVEVKRESVLNILEATQLDLKSLIGDAFNRIDILNNVLEDLSNKNDELNRTTLDKINDLERQIYELKVEMQRRGEYKETQNTSISYEIQRIVNIVEFIDPE